MASARQIQLINQLTPLMDAIVERNPALLVQKERLGAELSFESILDVLVDIVSSVSKLKATNLEAIPYPVLNQLMQAFQQLNQGLGQVSNFSPTAPNALQVRDSIITNLENTWGGVYVSVRVVLDSSRGEDALKSEIGELASQSRMTLEKSSEALLTLESKKREVDEKLAAFMEEQSTAFEKKGAERLSLVNSALEEVRRAAAEAGVSQTSTHFVQEATEHARSSKGWLWATATTGIALLIFSIFGTLFMTWVGVSEPGSDAKDMVYFRYFAQKGLVVFCLFFALLWCARNFSAAKHNYIVNKHRSNALASFQAFATSAADEQTKSAVLVQATQSVFSPQPSGYIKNDGENSPTSPIVEILRSATSAKDK